MRKLNWLWILTLLSILLLAACSGETKNEESQSGTSSDPVENEVEVKEHAQGVTDDEILIGHTGPQTGPLAQYDNVRKSIEVLFNYVNENGGINGRKLKLIAYDDQYQPAKTVQAAQRLINEDKVFSLVYPVGTANINAILPLLKETGIPVTGLGTGASMFFDPPIKNIFAGVFGYDIEAKIMMNYAIEQLGGKKLVVVYQNDDFGQQGQAAMKEDVVNYPGAEIVKEINFLATDKDLSAQAQQIKQANPDVILFFGTAVPAASLRQELHKINETDIPYVVNAVGGSDKVLFTLAGEDIWEGTYSILSNLQSELSDSPELKVYMEEVGKALGEDMVSQFTQAGWAQGLILVEALKRSGDDLSWENFLKQMESFDNWQGTLYPSVTFTPENHYGITSLFITQAKDGMMRPVTGMVTFDPVTEEFKYEE